MRVVTPAPPDTRDAPPDVPWLDVPPARGTASPPLVALPLAGDGHVVVGLDQVVARVGAVRRKGDAPAAVLPYPATVVTEVLDVLHGAAHRAAAYAVTKAREAPETPAPGLSPVPTVLPRGPRRVQQLVALVQTTGEAAGTTDGTGPRLIALARGELQLAPHAARRTPAIKCQPMDGHVAISVASAQGAGAPLAQGPVAPSQQDGILIP